MILKGAGFVDSEEEFAKLVTCVILMIDLLANEVMW
jgi:hypothetical protein